MAQWLVSADLMIWKYEFPIVYRFLLKLPRGARVLTAQMQGGKPVLWAEVNQGEDLEKRYFHVIGTGNPFPQDFALRYIATFQMTPLVWHLYEEL